MIKNCETCGAEILVYPSTASRKRFCSKKCLSDWQSKNMSGENSVHWKGGPAAALTRESKVCSKCGETKPTSDFHKGSDGGVKPECKSCTASMFKRYAATRKRFEVARRHFVRRIRSGFAKPSGGTERTTPRSARRSTIARRTG